MRLVPLRQKLLQGPRVLIRQDILDQPNGQPSPARRARLRYVFTAPVLRSRSPGGSAPEQIAGAEHRTDYGVIAGAFGTGHRSPPADEERSIVHQALTDHYRNTLDEPIPALGGQTPIGVRTRDGRRLGREPFRPQPGSASPPVAKRAVEPLAAARSGRFRPCRCGRRPGRWPRTRISAPSIGADGMSKQPVDAGGQAVIRVRDTGESEVGRALEPSGQIGRAGRKGGVGLGLPLTKALVEANKAEFSIKSRREPNWAGSLPPIFRDGCSCACSPIGSRPRHSEISIGRSCGV